MNPTRGGIFVSALSIAAFPGLGTVPSTMTALNKSVDGMQPRSSPSSALPPLDPTPAHLTQPCVRKAHTPTAQASLSVQCRAQGMAQAVPVEWLTKASLLPLQHV